MPARNAANEPAARAADGEAACPEPSEAAADSAPRQAKPKRKYTVSERSKASSRANLLRANLDPWGLKYRPTERRDASQHANLVKAAQSPRYASGFKRGTQCLSLRRSLFLAGETREEYEARRALFHRALGPVGEREERLVEAIFQASWRRRRVFRGHWRWEMMAVAWVLGKAAAERDRRGAPGLIEPEQAVALGFEVLCLFGNNEVGDEASRLNRRMERFIRVLVETEGVRPFAYQASRRQSEQGYEKQAAAVLGNPLRGRGEIEASLKREAGTVKDVSQWVHDGKGKIFGYDYLGAACAAWQRMKNFDRQGLLRARLEGPEGKAAWMKLWAAALGCEFAVAAGDAAASADPALASLQELAEVTWEWIEMFRRHAEKEDAAVEQALEDAVALQEIDDCRLTIDDCQDETRKSRLETREAGNPPPVADCPADETRDSQPETTSGGRVSNFEFPVSSSEQSSIDNRQSAIVNFDGPRGGAANPGGAGRDFLRGGGAGRVPGDAGDVLRLAGESLWRAEGVGGDQAAADQMGRGGGEVHGRLSGRDDWPEGRKEGRRPQDPLARQEGASALGTVNRNSKIETRNSAFCDCRLTIAKAKVETRNSKLETRH